MSKAVLYGILSAFVALTASVSYFFPVVSNINSYFSDKEETSLKVENNQEINPIETQASTSDESAASYVENPSVNINDDSIKKITNGEMNNNPLKSEMLQGEVPSNKGY